MITNHIDVRNSIYEYLSTPEGKAQNETLQVELGRCADMKGYAVKYFELHYESILKPLGILELKKMKISNLYEARESLRNQSDLYAGGIQDKWLLEGIERCLINEEDMFDFYLDYYDTTLSYFDMINIETVAA